MPYRVVMPRNRVRSGSAYVCSTGASVRAADGSVALEHGVEPGRLPGQVVPLGEVLGLTGGLDVELAGLAALAEVDPAIPRYTAVAAHLQELGGNLDAAGRLYVDAARQAQNLAERDHLTRQAARLHLVLGHG